MQCNLRGLTGLRAYAALAVFFCHSWIEIFANGYLAVDVFFVLSGFIISYTYNKAFSEGTFTLKKYWSFIIKRIARIYPVYLLSLAVFIVAGYISNTPISLVENIPTLVQNLLLVQNWLLLQSSFWNFPSWSISVEWFAYLFISIPVILHFRKLKTAYVILIAVILWASFIYLSQGILKDYEVVRIGILRIIPPYLAGYCVYILYKRNPSSQHTTLLQAISMLLLTYIFFANKFLAEILVVPASALLIYTIARENSLLNKFFDNVPMVFLGKLSYAIYLLHMPVYIALESFKPRASAGNLQIIWFVIFALIITTIAAYLTYKYIEEPLRKAIINQYSKTID